MATVEDLPEFAIEALRHYGDRAQARKCIEESGELGHALTVWIRGRCGPDFEKAVIDEIADVIIMAEQMRQAFGAYEVDERIAFKIERQRQRMRGGE